MMASLISEILVKKTTKEFAISKDFDAYETSLMNRLDYLDDTIGNLDKSATDEEIKELGQKIAGRIQFDLSMVHKVGKPIFISVMKHYCDKFGIRYPSEHDLVGIAARLTDQNWWTKKLRVAHVRQCEFESLNNGKVHKSADLYCSNETVQKRREQSKRNQELLEGISIQNESGYKMTLAEAASVGMANPFNRVSELVTRTKGFGDLADKYKHMCIFLTITAPSRFHATNTDGKKNKKYQGATPSDTQKYLTNQWAKCRARLAREGVKFYGLRVVEPHHDATPHWHASIWLKSEDDFKKLRRAVKDYFHRAKECDYLEKGALKNRLKFKRCDSRGAVGYMLKYILKNMRGHGIAGEDSDEGKMTSDNAAERVEAWAATWAIRQFQQLGGHSVSVWRELRRVNIAQLTLVEDRLINEFEGGQYKLERLMKAWRAAQKIEDKKANFAEFIEAMGGLDVKPKDSLLKLDDSYEVSDDGKYGKMIKHVISGVFDVLDNFTVMSNRQKWVVM
jgi:hypothetical protein